MQHIYRRLTSREREEISRSCALGIPQADIATMLSRHPQRSHGRSLETAAEQDIARSPRAREHSVQPRLVGWVNHD